MRSALLCPVTQAPTPRWGFTEPVVFAACSEIDSANSRCADEASISELQMRSSLEVMAERFLSTAKGSRQDSKNGQSKRLTEKRYKRAARERILLSSIVQSLLIGVNDN